MAPLYLFYNGPAANGFNSGRFNFYGVGGTPTVKFDGGAASSSPGTYPGTITSKLAVPSYVDIDVSIVGDASGGTAYYTITAEQDPGVSGQIKAFSVVTEDHEIASSAWGYYSGMEMMWIPVAWPLGTQGNVVNFTGPYPQTIHLSSSYTLNPVSHVFDNLNVVTFVQASIGTRQVLNAHYMDLPDTATGISEGSIGPSTTNLNIWPNPSAGSLNIGTLLSEGSTGTVTVFSIAGRAVQTIEAAPVSSLTMEEPGIYFAVLETSDGEVLTERFTIVD